MVEHQSIIQSHKLTNSSVNGSNSGRTTRILCTDELNSSAVVGIVLIKHMSSNLENVTRCSTPSCPNTYVENSIPASKLLLKFLI
jgi:hypothetical protein